MEVGYMSNDKEKLLSIMASLESDYNHGKISKEKYLYFRSKYEDKLNALDAREATSRIRSMLGKPSNDSKQPKKPAKYDKKEEQDLVQKYIINPKKGDKKLKERTPMDSGTFKLVAILVLAVGFTFGAAVGVFNFDFESLSDANAVAIVTDTAFPDVADIQVNNTVTNTSTTDVAGGYVETVQDTSGSSSQGSSSYTPSEPTPAPSTGGGGESPESGSSSEQPAG